jgi:uncharacterized protein YkwD
MRANRGCDMISFAPWPRVCMALLFLASAACGGGRVALAGEAARATRAAERYEIGEEPDAVLGSTDPQALERIVQRAGREAGLGLRGDGRLALLARRFAGVPRVDAATLAFAARERGLVDADLALQRVRAASAELLAAALATELAPTLRALQPTHFGVFVHPDGRTASVLSGRRPSAFDPLPRQLPAGATIHLHGRLAATYQNPKLLVSGPSGSLVLPAGAGPEIELRVPARTAGVYRLELQARVQDRNQTLAELVLYVGVPPPDARSSMLAPRSLAAVSEALYARTAELRATHGLSPLAVDPRLELHAARNSQQLAAAPSADDASERLGGPSLWTVARARDAEALWLGLLSAGGLRARLLSADVMRVGIGVAKTSGGLVATHVLAPLAPVIDTELAAARVLAALNENRRARGAPALRPDPDLTQVARRAAAELGAHPEQSERDVVERANAELEHFGLAYRRVAAVAARVHDPLESAALEPALGAEVCAAGIAVMQDERGDSDELGVVVVLALGWERSGR